MSKFTKSLKTSVTNGALGTAAVTTAMTPDHGNPLVNLAVGAVAGGVVAGVHKFINYDSSKPATKSMFQEEPKGNRNLGKQFK
jgi:hypothetical protein